MVEVRKYPGLAIDTLVAIAQDGQTDNSRQSAAVELLNRGYGRPAQSLDLHLSADAITKWLSDMTDAELAALEARMITIPAKSQSDQLSLPDHSVFATSLRARQNPIKPATPVTKIGSAAIQRPRFLLSGQCRRPHIHMNHFVVRIAMRRFTGS